IESVRCGLVVLLCYGWFEVVWSGWISRIMGGWFYRIEITRMPPFLEFYLFLRAACKYISLYSNYLQSLLNSLVDSIKFLFSAYTENMIEVFKVPRQ
ncbi:hypothetical protein L9F63_006981, partial [Diploptera punctata]